jgi:type I restriction-modification system DNA methylase subunit/restriction endonuclease S subunit
MLTKETKKRIDDARDTLVGVLPLPTDQIELITIGLIYKFMDDQDEELRQSGFDEKFFKGTLKEYSWQQLMSNQISADQRVTKFINGIEQIQKATEIPTLFKEIFQNAFLKFRDGKVLQRFLDLINGFSYSHSEELGNAFEYLLKTMGSQGNNGQFRTPKNIIDFMVDVVNPLKTDTILDPACGSGGFLVSSFKHLLRTNTKGFEHTRFTLNEIDEEKIYQNLGDKLTTDERKNIEKNIAGYDNTPLMVRLARVNLYLHHFNNPKIHEYNTLTTDTRWKDKFDCILANPPFMTPAGGIDPHDKFRIQATKTEILFSSYILQHLNSEKGKAGFIIPEGIIFTTSGDYVALRKWLLYEAGLWAVVSLPAGCFQPYSGVKTSILFIDKEIARNRTEVLMLKIENDGFSLNTNRNEIKANDLPEALQWLELSKTNKEEFVKQLEAKKDEAFAKKIQFLHRDEFAKLDAYKSSSLAYNFCTKLYDGIIKLKETIEVQITELKAEINKTKDKKKTEQLKERIEKANEKFDKKLQEFFKTTTITQLPVNKEELKTWFDANIKDNAIDFGVKLTNHSLPTAIKECIDSQRDFNLSFDKFTNEKIYDVDIEYVQLGEVCSIFDNLRKPIKKTERVKGKFPYYGATGIVDYVNEYIFDDRYVLIGEDGAKWLPSDKTAFIAENRFWANNHVHVLQTDNKKLLDSFLVEIINNMDLSDYITGVTVPKLNQEKLKSIKFPLPPIQIQQKIVEEIDQYQKVIDGCNLLIENYKPSFEIKKEWEMVELEQICEITSSKRIYQSEYTNEGIPFYRTKEVVELSNGNEISTELFISKERFEEIKKSFDYPKKGEILLSAVGTIGVSWVISDDREFYFKDGNLVWLKNFINANPNFIKISLDTIFKSTSNYAFGAAYNALTIVNLKQFKIYLPSIEEQNVIIENIQKEQSTINGARELKSKMELKIKEVIDKVW